MTDYPDEIVRSVYPGRAVAAVETPPEGNRKRTRVVTLDDGRFVVVQRSDDPAALTAETRLAREIADRTAVPVPAVLESGRNGDDGYRVVEHVAGENLHARFASLPAADRHHVARQFGRVLAELHGALTFERFGDLTVAADRLRADGPAEWAEWFEGYATAGVDALSAAFADLKPALREAVSSPDGDPTPRLYPWDLRPGNAVLRDTDLAAIPDWGEPLAGSAGLSVAKVEHLVADWYVEKSEPLRSAFRAGYRSVRPLPAVTRAERLAAVVRSAVDGDGEVTRPGYPERTGEAAVAFHRDRLESLL